MQIKIKIRFSQNCVQSNLILILSVPDPIVCKRLFLKFSIHRMRQDPAVLQVSVDSTRSDRKMCTIPSESDLKNVFLASDLTVCYHLLMFVWSEEKKVRSNLILIWSTISGWYCSESDPASDLYTLDRNVLIITKLFYLWAQPHVLTSSTVMLTFGPH